MTIFINTSDPKLVIVSLKDGDQVVSTMTKENQFGSQALLPLIDKLLIESNLDKKELTAVEVKEGPGSYTGLRVGASVAQAIGFALNIPVNGKLKKAVELSYTG